MIDKTADTSSTLVYLSAINTPSCNEATYLGVRASEGRILSDEQVKKLPHTRPNDPHHTEWQLRLKSYKRLLSVLARKQPKHVLDIGCGNGWLAHQLSQDLAINTLRGVDLNQEELLQASRLFSNERLQFYFLDIIADGFTDSPTFDCIVFNASIQYFPDLSEIIARAKSMLSPKGLILINDSPCYASAAEAQQAADRSSNYYSEMGYPEMAAHYHHHSRSALSVLGFVKHGSWLTRLSRHAFPLYIYTAS